MKSILQNNNNHTSKQTQNKILCCTFLTTKKKQHVLLTGANRPKQLRHIFFGQFFFFGFEEIPSPGKHTLWVQVSE
jgi:hypothetical protein